VTNDESALSSASVRVGRSNLAPNQNLACSRRGERTNKGRKIAFIHLGRTGTGRRVVYAGLTPKREARPRLGFSLALALIASGVSTPAWCVKQFQAQKPGVSRGDKCMAFIQTTRPGIDVSVPYGNVYPTLAEAREEAANRCSQTSLAQDGWGPCKTWCVKVNHGGVGETVG
jgi:hypothetical protein